MENAKNYCERILLVINFFVVIWNILVKFGTVPDLDILLNVVQVLLIIVAWWNKKKLGTVWEWHLSESVNGLIIPLVDGVL